MLLGILSDSHGDAAITARAVALLEELGAKRFFHCGDICDLRVLDELAGRDALFVWGNCDAPPPTARRYVQSLGLPWPHSPVRSEANGKSIELWHGHEHEFARARRAPNADYVFYGHTHRRADERVGGSRFINPGALYRASVHTVALLDARSDSLQFIDVATGEVIK